MAESNDIKVWINIQERKSLEIIDPVVIPIRNANFTGGSDWHDLTDSWTPSAGAMYHNYVSPQTDNLLWQSVSGLCAGDVYTVNFFVVGRSQGYVTASLGDDSFDYNSNGAYSFNVEVDSDESSVQRVAFKGQSVSGSSWFDGGISAVTITRNTDLSPKREVTWYSTKGKVYPVNSIPLALIFQIADVQDFGKSRGSKSHTIQVVADAEADYVFGHLSNIATTFDAHDPRYKHRVQVVQDGSIVFEGYGRLLGASYRDTQLGQTERVYNMTITDDAASFSEDAEQFNLSNLNLTAYDHTLSIGAIMAKSAATYSDVYCYPTLWVDDAESYRVKDHFPAFFFWSLWTKSCEALGYRTQFSDPFVLSKLQQAVIPYAGRPKLLSEADVEHLSTRVNLRNEQDFPATYYYSVNWGSVDVVNSMIHFNGEEYDDLDQWDPALYTFTADQTLDYQLNVDLPLEIWTTLQAGGVVGAPRYSYPDGISSYMRLVVRKNGMMLTSYEQWNPYVFTNAPANGMNATVELLITGQTFSLLQGDVLTVHLDHYHRHGFLAGLNRFGMICNAKPVIGGSAFVMINATKSEVGEGSTIQLGSYLPNLTFWDLVNYARTKFNLFVHSSEYDPTLIHLDTRNDFFGNSEQLDWNDFFANEYHNDHKLIPALISESFLFTDAKGGDNFNKNYSELNHGEAYGQVAVRVKTDLAKGVKTIGPAKFAATPIAKNRFGHFVPAIDARNLPSEPRVLLFSGATYGTGPDNGVPITYWNGVANVTSKFPVSHCLMEDSISNMDFSLAYGPPKISILTADSIDYTEAGCYQRYWSEHIQQVSTGKIFTGYFRLPSSEIIKLKKGLNKIVGFDGQNYIINRVLDYAVNKAQVTKVELLLLENFHGLFNQRRTSVRPWTASGYMSNLPLATLTGPSSGGFVNGGEIGRTSGTTVVIGSGVVGTSTDAVLVVGEDVIVDAGVQDAAAIGIRYGTTLTEDGQVRLGDFVEITATGEFVVHDWFVGGITEEQTGIDPLMLDYPVVIIGGTELEVRQTPSSTDDAQHWFTYGGDEAATIPAPPLGLPTQIR